MKFQRNGMLPLQMLNALRELEKVAVRDVGPQRMTRNRFGMIGQLCSFIKLGIPGTLVLLFSEVLWLGSIFYNVTWWITARNIAMFSPLIASFLVGYLNPNGGVSLAVLMIVEGVIIASAAKYLAEVLGLGVDAIGLSGIFFVSSVMLPIYMVTCPLVSIVGTRTRILRKR